MRRTRHPSIIKIGRVQDIGGGTLLIAGWGLSVCAAGCPCHRNPATGDLVIAEDHVDGHLGLVSFSPGGCLCCEPWSAYELADVLRDLADIAALQHTT